MPILFLKRGVQVPFLGSVYQIFGLYPEIYYAMISMEIKEQPFVDEDAEQEDRETEA
jgi:hypothetical protein